MIKQLAENMISKNIEVKEEKFRTQTQNSENRYQNPEHILIIQKTYIRTQN